MDQPQEDTKVAAALYARGSATDEGEDSTASQVERMQAFCEENGIPPGTAYTDQGDSKEALDQMMEDATGEDLTFQRIVVYDMNRFSRSMQETIEFAAKLEAN